MSMRFKYALIGFSLLVVCGFVVFRFCQPSSSLPLITIANWGPHASLDETVRGIKEGLEAKGFKENETILIKMSHVNFDPTLISQMISNMRAQRPKVMVALSTPVAQVLKNSEKNIPIVFSAVTDPIEGGLITHPEKSHENVSGASEQQDLELFLRFAKDLLPKAQTVGILYATGEANDFALVKLMQKAAQKVVQKPTKNIYKGRSRDGFEFLIIIQIL